LYFVIGGSVYIKRSNARNYKLGSDQYFLNEDLKTSPIPSDTSIVQKPFGRWFTEYPTPYLIKQGVYKNWKSIQVLQNKGNEVITKILPYLFLMQKGTENMYLQDKGEYTDAELKTMVANFKDAVERYNKEGGKLPATAVPFDQKYEHLIPDLLPILREELYAQGSRSILSGLGFIDVVQGVSSTRKESVLNPKPFIAEVNAGVDGFKTMLMDIIGLIVLENKGSHKKLFSDNTYLKIISSPLKINVETLIDSLRSAFVYGTISIKTYQEILGIDPEQELERMRKEMSEGLRDIYYPHLIQNTEKDPDVNVTVPPKVTKKQEEKQVEKEKQPVQEAEEAVAQESLEIAPYDNLADLPPAVKKYPEGAQKVWLEVFNSIYKETQDEARAFAGAWSKLKKWVDRHGDKQAKEETK
jgi:cation transport regulator ChaB